MDALFAHILASQRPGNQFDVANGKEKYRISKSPLKYKSVFYTLVFPL